MENVAVLLLTIWLGNGQVTARAIIAPSYAECEANRQDIVELMQSFCWVAGGVRA